VRNGFDIAQLIREFVTLRHVIRDVAREHGAVDDSADAMLADLIDAAIAESVRAYIEARDREVRRAQANNIGFLTHELRNPLVAAVQAAALLRAQSTSGQKRALDIVDRNHQRLTELIDSVLATERLEAGTIEPLVVEIRVGDLVDAATTVARNIADDKGLAFEVQCDPDRRVRADLELTRSALQNLVDNAVKYTDTGRVEVTVHERETMWSIHVRDSCPGLSADELRTIFEPFHRGSTSKPGTGLGLAIARRAIEAQGGAIRVESRGHAGCHFWFTLPKP
jgi:signal transduction histidine kinase